MRQHRKGLLLTAVFLVTAVLLPAGSGWAKPEFSDLTGLECGVCHVDGDMGGALTPFGESYRAAGYRLVENGTGSPTATVFLRLLFGSIHVIFAFAWFGAIIYIHLFIKPKQFAGGLPKSEIRLGWTCIVVLAITGTILTFFRMHRIDELWSTTFGIVWTVKVAAFLVMVLIAGFVTTRVNRRMKEEAGNGQAQFPWFVFRGEVYDVAASRFWKDGVHMERHRTGEDLTPQMESAPHGEEVLERIRKIGRASGAESPKPAGAAKLFMVLAFVNLGLVVVILLCLSYWNWGPPLVGP